MQTNSVSHEYPIVEVDSWAVFAKHLGLAFGGQKIFEDAAFSFPKAGTVLLRGDNGSGKTTLLNLLSGLLRPDAGLLGIRLKNRVYNPASSGPEDLARAGLGRLWQDIRLFPTMTVLENVISATQMLAGQNPLMVLAAWPLVRRQEKEAKERVLANLEIVGMVDRADSSADMLSAGQMKRVALARLLQAEAEVWLLDEPLAGLDQDSANSFLRLLKKLKRASSKTIIIVEHQYEKIAPICDQVWQLQDRGMICMEHG